MGTNFKMQGELESGLLMDMLQVMTRRKTLNGYVEVSASAMTGRIWLQEGAIIAADWNGRKGELAVECMLRLKQGQFMVGEATELPAKTIVKDTVALLMLCLRAIGRDALAPVAPARLPSSPPAQCVVSDVSGSPADQSDEPMPAPAHHAGVRPSKRGFLMAGRWMKPVAVAAGVALVVGLSVTWGARFLTEKKASAAVNPIMEPRPPAVMVVATTPEKPPVVIQDGWPDIILSALAASGQRQCYAILNGQLLGVGEQVDGVTVRSIRANGVMLEYLGKRRFLCAVQQR
ncbi:MAG: DUF4388 domain-containing protein [bacterium]